MLIKSRQRVSPFADAKSQSKLRRVSIYISEYEFEVLKTKLQIPLGMHIFTVGRRISDHFRRSERGMRPAQLPAPEMNRFAWTKLSRTASNLNQLTAAINSGRASGVDVELLKDLRSQVENLRSIMLGVV